jgi:hypothetical protein
MIFENEQWHLSDNWYIEDVRNVIDCDDREDARDFTDDDCVRVLELVVEAFDANMGVSWYVIGAAIDMVVQDKQGEKK